jgi:peptidoglycan-associated lipoprotein
MKTMKMIYAVAFAVALAATGCAHKPVNVTPMPPGPTPPPVEPTPGTMQDNTMPGTQLSTDTNATGVEISQANPALFQGMIEDTNALASYTAHFKYDSAAVQRSDKTNLEAVASALTADASTKLLIEGNCDERGTDEYNRALGERRALALREALAKIGVDPSRIRTISYGKDKPVDPGHDEEAWAKNRRGDFVLLHPNPNSPDNPNPPAVVPQS